MEEDGTGEEKKTAGQKRESEGIRLGGRSEINTNRLEYIE